MDMHCQSHSPGPHGLELEVTAPDVNALSVVGLTATAICAQLTRIAETLGESIIKTGAERWEA